MEVIPPPIVRHAEPPTPAGNLKLTNVPKLGERAQLICYTIRKIFAEFKTD
jgi:hypothetical protein